MIYVIHIALQFILFGLEKYLFQNNKKKCRTPELSNSLCTVPDCTWSNSYRISKIFPMKLLAPGINLIIFFLFLVKKNGLDGSLYNT